MWIAQADIPASGTWSSGAARREVADSTRCSSTTSLEGLLVRSRTVRAEQPVTKPAKRRGAMSIVRSVGSATIWIGL